MYIFHKLPYVFVQFKAQKIRALALLIEGRSIFYCALHMRFGSLSYSNQLVDIMAYEMPTVRSNYLNRYDMNLNNNIFKRNNADQSIIVYNFHSCYTQERFYFFVQNFVNLVYSRVLPVNNMLDSITEIFFSAN